MATTTGAAANYKRTQKDIKYVREVFQRELSNALNLLEVSAPALCRGGSGVQDDLNGTETPVRVAIKTIPGRDFEVVHSLAKWKRLALSRYGFLPGEGLVTNMKALRPSEDTLDHTHSVCVDQWDWEAVILPEQRGLPFLKSTVEKIYGAIKATELKAAAEAMLAPVLPERITFIHSEDLCRLYPGADKSARERELCRKYGAVFLIGIGGELPDGTRHDGRAPDYDDWTTPTAPGYRGLNGDILVWNPAIDDAFELSSMGIRVSPEAMTEQLRVCGCQERAALSWHQMLLKRELPSSIGGGIGQSRLIMFLLGKTHIGQVQASVWPDSHKWEELL